MQIYTPAKYKKNRRTFAVVRRILVLVLLIAIVIGITYTIFFSQLFTNFEVRVKGAQYIHADHAYRYTPNLWGISIPPNILFVDVEHMESNLLEEFPQLANVTVERFLSDNLLAIDAVERERVLVWCTTVSCYWVDREGVVFDIAPETSGRLIPVVHDAHRSTLTFGERVLGVYDLEMLISFFTMLDDRNLKWERAHAQNPQVTEIWITLNTGPVVRIAMRTATEELFAAFFEILKDLRPDEVEYFDLTVENRIYYKEID